MAFPKKPKSHGPGLLYILGALIVVAIAGARFFGFAPPGGPGDPPPGGPPPMERPDGEPRVLPDPSVMTEVLIYHAHTTENYAPKDPHQEDGPGDVVKVGEAMVGTLDEQDVGAVHIVTVHDLPEWSRSFANAKRSVDDALSRHGGIRAVIDVHRDAAPEQDEPDFAVTEVEGRRTARMLFIVGSADNPLVDANVRYAERIRDWLEAEAPGITRGVRILQQTTNGDLHENSLTVYIGDYEGSTIEEAEAAAQWLAKAVAAVLREDG